MTTSATKATAATAAVNGDAALIPLNRLKKHPQNARKTPHSEASIEAKAASIAAKGMLQNLVVEPELDACGEPTGFYLVAIGEGRRLAQLLRVKRKQDRCYVPVAAAAVYRSRRWKRSVSIDCSWANPDCYQRRRQCGDRYYRWHDRSVSHLSADLDRCATLVDGDGTSWTGSKDGYRGAAVGPARRAKCLLPYPQYLCIASTSNLAFLWGAASA